MTDLDEVRSVRTDGDSWEITESVGATALSVAACRAAETAQPQPLIRDEFAYLLVSKAGEAWARLASGRLDWLDDDDEYGRRVTDLGRDYQAVRTHFFDTYFADATAAGIRQAVILAAGLDARAYRLDWPAHTTVYEIDQPQVLAYKGATLDAAGARPTATRRAVPIDLRGDWPSALAGAGFDAAQPTAWLAEGLLPYLPADAQDRLFEMVTALSAPGSRIAVEAFAMFRPGADGQRRKVSRERRARLRDRLGLDVNVESLVYHEDDRADAASLLDQHGWQVQAVDSRDEAARLGRAVPDDLAEQTASTTLLIGRR
ncbi:class I SAM-dependent methyltransferase [Mycobacterium eburneum]|nr:class I SAM-dependent methyltransferase [Mycobacterium eburneum]TDH56416.1 class I SAM-dependent methyltransferase [Mycobacterium eburneum]